MGKRQYRVFKVENRLHKPIGDTWAVSEGQAMNNVAHRHWPNLPKDRRPPMYATVVTEPQPAQPKKAMRSWEPQPFPGTQLVLF